MPHRLAYSKYASELDDAPDLTSLPRFRVLRNSELVNRLKAAVPFEYIAVAGLDVNGYRIGEAASMDSTLPPTFVETYTSDRLNVGDPLVAKVKETGDIVQDSDIAKFIDPRLQYLLRTFRIFNRLLIPVGPTTNVFGGVMFAREKPFSAEEIYFLSVVADATHQVVTGPIMEKFGASALRLTRGELACLQQAYFGLTSDEISKRTGFQRETVNAYVKAATKKLGASNRTRAIIEALQRGLLHAG